MEDKEELEEELELYKERLEEAMEVGNLSWWEMELPSREVIFNERKAEMLGYAPERFETYEDFTELLHPKDYEKAMGSMRSHLEGKEERYEVEYRIRKENGDYKWFRDVGSITNEDGDNKKITGVVIDIDKRKKSQQREEFLHSLLRHDVRNKNRIVEGYLEQMRDPDLPEEVNDLIDKAKRAARDSAEIIDKVRKLREIEEEDEIVEMNLNSIVDEALSKNQGQIQERGIDIERDEVECKVKGGSLLEELFFNLIENSIKHSGCDKIKIHSRSEEDECVVTVEDDGIGVSDEVKEKIFKRGYKKGENAGSGLGMHLVKEIAESYGGKMEVKDSDFGGARFDVHLKRV